MKIQNLIVNHEHNSHLEGLGEGVFECPLPPCLTILEKCQTGGQGAVAKIKVLGGGVTDSIF